jgi:hypothetical protein
VRALTFFHDGVVKDEPGKLCQWTKQQNQLVTVGSQRQLDDTPRRHLLEQLELCSTRRNSLHAASNLRESHRGSVPAFAETEVLLTLYSKTYTLETDTASANHESRQVYLRHNHPRMS